MSYPITWQLKIVTMLTELIERINPTNTDPATNQPYACPDWIINPATKAPYEWDFRKRVHRGKTVLGDGKYELPPSVTILEPERPIQGLYLGDETNQRIESLALYFQGFAPDVATHKNDSAYVMMGQVQQLLARISAKDRKTGLPMYPEDYMLGVRTAGSRETLLTDLTIGAGTVRPPTANISPTAFFYIPVVAKFKFDPLCPWAN